MSSNPVNAWDARAFVVSETTLGTTPAPANVAAYAARALEFSAISTGPGEVGAVRAKKDRALGRGMTTGFVEGRVGPIPWSLEIPVKSRSAVDALPLENVVYSSAGLALTVSTGAGVIPSPSTTPVESAHFVPMSLTRILGVSPATRLLETLRGCVTKTLRWEGGDKEVLLKASGDALGKSTQGELDSVTLASGGVTSLTVTAEESYRLANGLGYYLIESEIVQVTACTAGSTTATIARGALGSTAAAHTAVRMQPYTPTGVAYTGSPIAETTSSVSLGGVTSRVQSWFFEYSSGMELLGGETGSRYAQGVKYGRYDGKLGCRLVLTGDQVSLVGKATSRPTVALAISQGTGVGGIWSLSAPYAEVEAFSVPDNQNDIAIVDLSFRLRDNAAGNNMWSLTLT